MNRLLLGDVGTGKTAIAALAIAAAADGGHQAAMMAPTEVLAAQYAKAVGPVLDAADVSWALLTGSTPTAQRREALDAVANGQVSALLGTHALFSEDVRFADLSLAIVDEQHRFGVAQRRALREKGAGADLLVMSATPIPRSLALTVFGDLDTSYLRQRPSGRKPGDAVTTRVLHASERSVAYEEVRKAVAAGGQAYVVCPLVEESEAADAKAATDEANRLTADVFPDLSVDLVTGRMTSDEKTAAMRAFSEGDTDVLVATTVVEVGVDVPNAAVMIVEDAERFGLAQLHQLRGRVGRGEAPGRFFLFADPSTDEGVRRMAAIESVSDGFELAEIDLELRGEGDLLGHRQSGAKGLLAASVVTDRDWLEEARADVQALLHDANESDPILAPARDTAAERFPGVAEGWTGAG
jgi:ATP-dependent DNA helicase RecG